MKQDSVTRLNKINTVLREMLLHDAMENVILERRMRRGPSQSTLALMQRVRDREEFKRSREGRMREEGEARRRQLVAMADERRTARLNRQQERWRERFAQRDSRYNPDIGKESNPDFVGPPKDPNADGPPDAPPPSSGQTVTPPSARDDWYNDPKPNEMSKSSDWRRYIPQYPDSRLTTPPAQRPSPTTPPPPASEQQRAGFGQVRPSELDQNTRGGTPSQTEQQRRDKNEAEMQRRMADQGVPSDQQRLADARAEQQRRGVTPNQNAGQRPTPSSQPARGVGY